MMPYEPFDGPYAGHTDAKYLSIGRAQWNEDNEPDPDISAKVWRQTDNKWSRMSEELPLHRVVDLCILIVAMLSEEQGASVIIPAGTFENQTDPIELKKCRPVGVFALRARAREEKAQQIRQFFARVGFPLITITH
jgi:hypothetical protein